MTHLEPINIHDAKNHLSKLCELAASGQDVLLARYGQPWVRLTALEPVKRTVRYGLLAGDVVISEDFDARFPAEEADAPLVSPESEVPSAPVQGAFDEASAPGEIPHPETTSSSEDEKGPESVYGDP